MSVNIVHCRWHVTFDIELDTVSMLIDLAPVELDISVSLLILDEIA